MAEEEMVVTEGDITKDDKMWAMLSWIIWPIAVIVLFLEDKKGRPFIKNNAVQSLVLNGAAWATTIIGIGVCIGPLALIYAIFLGIKAYGGNEVTVPVITNFCQTQGWI